MRYDGTYFWKKGWCTCKTYPLIGIVGNHFKITEEDRYILSARQMVFVRGLEKQKRFLSSFPSVTQNLQKNSSQLKHKMTVSGGQDVSPLLMAKNHIFNLASYLSSWMRLKLSLIKEAYRQHKPIFAVCRGYKFKRRLAEHLPRHRNHNMKIFLWNIQKQCWANQHIRFKSQVVANFLEFLEQIPVNSTTTSG